MDSELQGAFNDVRDLCDGSEPDSLHVLVDAARKWERLGFTRCDTCDGRGSYPPMTRQVCPTCKALGWLIPDTMIEAAADELEKHLPENVQPYGLRLAESALVAAFSGEAPDGQ